MGVIRFLGAFFPLALSAWAQGQWVLVWSDEFNGPANSPPSTSNWNYDLGGGGWGHQELQTYTNSNENSYLDGNGNLVIQAKKDAVLGFTSARLQTHGKFEIAYGMIEARIKLPSGQGMWPAFWMLGSGFPAVPWPQCGEIDIVENIGGKPSVVFGTLHGPGNSGGARGTVAFSGLAPTYIGLYQINVVVPTDSPSDNVDLTIVVNGVASKSVKIAIQ